MERGFELTVRPRKRRFRTPPLGDLGLRRVEQSGVLDRRARLVRERRQIRQPFRPVRARFRRAQG
jgi:hypothetical protein